MKITSFTKQLSQWEVMNDFYAACVVYTNIDFLLHKCFEKINLPIVESPGNGIRGSVHPPDGVHIL